MPRGRSTTPAAKATPARSRAASSSRAKTPAKTEKSPAPKRGRTPAKGDAEDKKSRAATPRRAAAPKAAVTATRTPSPTPAPAAPVQTAGSASKVAAPAPAPAASAAKSAAGTRELMQFLLLASAVAFVSHKAAGVSFLTPGWLSALAIVPHAIMGINLLHNSVDNGKLSRDTFTTWTLLFIILFTTNQMLGLLQASAPPSGTRSALDVLLRLYDFAQTMTLVVGALQAEKALPANGAWTIGVLSAMLGFVYARGGVEELKATYLPGDMNITNVLGKLTVVLSVGVAAIGISRAITAWRARRSDVWKHVAAAFATFVLSQIYVSRIEPKLESVLHIKSDLATPVTEWLAIAALAYAAS